MALGVDRHEAAELADRDPDVVDLLVVEPRSAGGVGGGDAGQAQVLGRGGKGDGHRARSPWAAEHTQHRALRSELGGFGYARIRASCIAAPTRGDHGMDAGIQDQLNIVGEDVWLTVPPFSEYLRTVRLVAADAAVRGGPRLRRGGGLPHRRRRALPPPDVVDRPRDLGVVRRRRPLRSRTRSGPTPARASRSRRSTISRARSSPRWPTTTSSPTRDDELGFAVMKETRRAAER